jgi:aerobic C4-dicarboxylate transport protein
MAFSSGALHTGPASGKSPVSTPPKRKPFYRTLLFQILLGLLGGLAVGIIWPEFGSALKPLGDGFINLVKMIIAPLVFCVVVIGIAGAGDLASLKRIGLKTLIYFEVVTTLALIIGVAMTVWLKPGEGLNIDLSHSRRQQCRKEGWRPRADS